MLGDLPRYVLADLGDRLAAGHGHDTTGTHPDGAPRVAPADDPTSTRWVSISADPAATGVAIRDAGTNPDHMIIIEAVGYGRYGRQRHRLDLDVLCAIGQVAGTHQESRYAVGEWLAAERATHVDVRPADVVDDYPRAYLGAFPSELDHTLHRMAELGWTTALRRAGIPQDYLDVTAIRRDWSDRDVRHIDSGTPGRIEVLRQAPPTAPDSQSGQQPQRGRLTPTTPATPAVCRTRDDVCR